MKLFANFIGKLIILRTNYSLCRIWYHLTLSTMIEGTEYRQYYDLL